MRPLPPEWGPDLWTGDLWAACTATIPAPALWTDDDVSWLDAAVDWLGDGPTTRIEATPVGGTLTRDWSGPSARTTATIEIPDTTPLIGRLRRGLWITLRGHVTTPDHAPADGNPAAVPSCVIASLCLTTLTWDTARAVVVIAAEDLVTLLGARQLDTGAGPAGYLPAGRSCKAVITELVHQFTPTPVTVTDTAAPDAPWAPETDQTTGQPLPLTGTVWSAIETMATLAGITLSADGPSLLMGNRTAAEDPTGLVITEDPRMPGTVAPSAFRVDAPAVTRVIVTGTDAVGSPIAGRATDIPTRIRQGFDWDDSTSIAGATTPSQLITAAASRLEWLRAQQTAGSLRTPWLPMLEPGDLVQVSWHSHGPHTHYVHSITLPLNPLEPTELAVRGGGWVTWQEWADQHTWESLRADTWMNRLRTG